MDISPFLLKIEASEPVRNQKILLGFLNLLRMKNKFVRIENQLLGYTSVRYLTAIISWKQIWIWRFQASLVHLKMLHPVNNLSTFPRLRRMRKISIRSRFRALYQIVCKSNISVADWRVTNADMIRYSGSIGDIMSRILSVILWGRWCLVAIAQINWSHSAKLA